MWIRMALLLQGRPGKVMKVLRKMLLLPQLFSLAKTLDPASMVGEECPRG